MPFRIFSLCNFNDDGRMNIRNIEVVVCHVRRVRNGGRKARWPGGPMTPVQSALRARSLPDLSRAPKRSLCLFHNRRCCVPGLTVFTPLLFPLTVLSNPVSLSYTPWKPRTSHLRSYGS